MPLEHRRAHDTIVVGVGPAGLGLVARLAILSPGALFHALVAGRPLIRRGVGALLPTAAVGRPGWLVSLTVRG